jgi:hypothetical protein
MAHPRSGLLKIRQDFSQRSSLQFCTFCTSVIPITVDKRYQHLLKKIALLEYLNQVIKGFSVKAAGLQTLREMPEEPCNPL